MEVRNIRKPEMKQLLRDLKLNDGNVFVEYGKKYRLSRDFISDFHKTGDAIKPSYGVNREQIAWLDSKKYHVGENKLPGGVVSYQGVDVGVMYPSYYIGYFPGENLSKEDAITILKVLRNAIADNQILMENGIYNEDFVLKNIIYLGKRAGLVGLDGQYIKKAENSSIERVYSYFDGEMYKLIDAYLRPRHREKASEYSALMMELIGILSQPRDKGSIEYPSLLLDDIEKAKILTLD